MVIIFFWKARTKTKEEKKRKKFKNKVASKIG